jgi:DNA polymerase II small subunit
MRRKVVQALCAKGILIEPSALRILLSKDDPLAELEHFLATSAQKPLVITSSSLAGHGEAPADVSRDACALPPTTSPDEEEPDEPLAEGGCDAAPEQREHPFPPPSRVEPSQQTSEDPPVQKTLSLPNGVAEGGGTRPAAVERRTSVAPRAAAKGYDADVEVIQEVTDESRCTGQASDFVNYFEDRFRSLSRMLRQRPEMGGSVAIESATRFDSREARVICMVNEVARPQDRRAGGAWLTVEDETGSMKVWLPDEGGMANLHVLKDEVVGVIGKVQRPKEPAAGKERGNYIVAQRVVRPELAGPRTPRRSENPLTMACAGDVHVGSSHFLPKPWERLVSWLKSSEGTAGTVKYLLMPGDLVDGIGVYPNQDEELEIDDIYLQYERFSTMLEEIPDHITLVMLPGNHDAQRLSEPQPALPVNVRKIVGSRPVYVGNPSYLMVDGVRVLAYHGRGFDDFAGNLGPIGYQQPMLLMQEMLKRRHLSPIYGGKNQLAPERRDYMVINPIPDIFVTGHVHGAGIEDYKGVVIANSSTYQSQTPFQLMHNFNPDPGKVPWIRLDTFEFGLESFA